MSFLFLKNGADYFYLRKTQNRYCIQSTWYSVYIFKWQLFISVIFILLSLLFLLIMIHLVFGTPVYHLYLDLLDTKGPQTLLRCIYLFSILIKICIQLPFSGMIMCLLTPLSMSDFPILKPSNLVSLSRTWLLFLVWFWICTIQTICHCLRI